MEFKPHPYQRRMMDMIKSGQSVALWADMGMGKTATVLTEEEDRIYDQCIPTKVLVLAPKRVADDTWSTEAQKWEHLSHLRVVRLSGSPSERSRILKNLDQGDVFVMCRNLIPWLFEQFVLIRGSKWKWITPWPFNVVVLDEASAFRSPSGVWFKTMARIKRSGCQIIELTGTPSPRSMEDLWAQVFLLDGGERLGRSITAYRERWFTPGDTVYTPGGVPRVVSWNLKPGAFEEIMGKLSDISVSLLADDWLKMPERIDREVKVTLPAVAMTQYKKMERDAVVKMKDKIVTAGSAGVVVGKLLQMANGRVYDENRGVVDIHTSKLEALKEIMENATSPVLVFYSYQHDLESILSTFSEAKLLDSTDMIKEWNEGKIQMLLAHPASAGHGLNIQAGGNVIVWYGLPYNLEWYLQANARLRRQGQKAPCVIIHHIVASGTVDEDVMAALARKGASQESVLAAVRYRLEVLG